MNLLSLILFMALLSPVDVEPRFAVACTGSAHAYGNSLGKMRDRIYVLPKQIYVMDPATDSVSRVLEPRKEFELVCGNSADAFRSISAGLVQARSEEFKGGSTARCELQLDRMSGKGAYILRMDWPDGRYESFDWVMVCAKSEIPVFDLSKRKF